jgi:Cysteine-rich secretory protein family
LIRKLSFEVGKVPTRRLGRVALALLGSLVALAAIGQGTAAAEGCLYENDPATNDLVHAERTLLCLNNAVRLHAGLNALAMDRRLQGAATAHSADMVARVYFNHLTPEGLTPSARAIAAGYLAGVGESIGASTGTTPILVFRAWRASAGHNANLLYRTYQATGIGVVPGYPFPGGGSYTVTQMFGTGPSTGSDTALDLYYPNRRCRKAKLAKRRKKPLARKLRRACQSKPAKPRL